MNHKDQYALHRPGDDNCTSCTSVGRSQRCPHLNVIANNGDPHGGIALPWLVEPVRIGIGIPVLHYIRSWFVFVHL